MEKFLKLNTIAFLLSIMFLISCQSGNQGKSSKARKQDTLSMLSSNRLALGNVLEIEMLKGKAHNHPTFVLWVEDMDGRYIQTLFITRAIGQGIFTYADNSGNKWKPGEVKRPAALPYWAHKRGILYEDGSLLPNPRNKIPDAYSGATPQGSFMLNTRTDEVLKGKVRLMLEINQTWDWNEYWTNTRYIDDAEYKTSCQPAIVYSAEIDLEKPGLSIEMKPIGHSHHSGKTGDLFTDLSSITTALHIADKLVVTVK